MAVRVYRQIQLRSLGSVQGMWMSIATAGNGCTGATVCNAQSGNGAHVDVAIRVVFWLVLSFSLSAGSVGGRGRGGGVTPVF